MSIIWYIVYLASFVALGLWSLFYRNIVTGQRNTIEIRPQVILVASYVLYSVSLPVSRIFFGSAGNLADASLLKLHLFGHLGFALGTVGSVLIAGKGGGDDRLALGLAIRQRYGGRSLRLGIYVILLPLMAGRYFWLLLQELGFNFYNILQPYGFEALEGAAQSNLADVFVYFGLYSLIVLGVAWNTLVRPLPVLLKAMTYAIAAMLAVFWLLRGSRNMTFLLMMPFVTVLLYKKQIRIVSAVAVGVFLIFALYLLGSIRGLGLRNVSSSELAYVIRTMDPLNGELGTSYSVVGRALQKGGEFDKLWGRSYVVDPLFNMAPRSWWPNRPDNIAVEFSKAYFNTNELTEGLGFSPILEAYVNFGEIGIIGAFAVIFLVVIQFEKMHKIGNIGHIMIMSFAMPIIVNWNRIDMSTTLKMYSGFVFMALILPVLVIGKGHPKPRRFGQRRPASSVPRVVASSRVR